MRLKVTICIEIFLFCYILYHLSTTNGFTRWIEAKKVTYNYIIVSPAVVMDCTT